jgi:hypothetical protein
MSVLMDAIVAICALLVCAVSCAQDPCAPVERPVAANPIYENDFSRGLGDEWSVDTRVTSPTGVQFLGRFSDETAQLSLSGLPSHTSLTLTFKLYIIHSWDGNLNGQHDHWKCNVLNGPTVLMASFSNTVSYQNYPHDTSLCGVNADGCYQCPAKTGASAVDSLGFTGPYSSRGDAIYEIAVTFPHSEGSIVIEFQGLMDTEGLDDESWGIDDVYLWKGPATFPTK